ncbi:MAG: Ig-like domain-containing protein, partial [Chthoniobacteraceae bacterium]
MNRRVLQFAAAFLSLSGADLVAQIPFTGSHSENFDSMGTAGTAPPAGWSIKNGSGSSGTWTNATGIPAANVAAMGSASGPLAVTAAPIATDNDGFNTQVPGDANNRVLATSPTSVAGVAIEAALTNATGSAIGAIRIRYDIRRFNDPPANQLPGYWLFYSVNGGTTWQNVTALNPTLAGPAGVIVPRTTGVTTVPATAVTLASPWGAGTTLLLRWVDDNAQESSPDQIVGLDNVVIDLPVGSAPTVAITSPGNGSTFATGSTIPITADAMDADGSITKVEFFEGATKLGEDVIAPYQYAWTGIAAGNYGITARATDDSGNTTASVPVSVTVIPGPSGTLTRGPYLNQANQNSIVVRWRSSQAIVGRVRYGTSIAMLDQFADEPAAAVTEHEVRL